VQELTEKFTMQLNGRFELAEERVRKLEDRYLMIKEQRLRKV
jgi:hypothetical protein